MFKLIFHGITEVNNAKFGTCNIFFARKVKVNWIHKLMCSVV